MNEEAFFSEARKSFHAALLSSVLRTDSVGVPSNADRHSSLSLKIAKGIIGLLGAESQGARLDGQMAGSRFEEICKEYLEETLPCLAHLRPGQFEVMKGDDISHYDQYEHLAALGQASKENPELAAALGSDYLIKPDVVVVRFPEDESTVNASRLLASTREATHTPLRRINNTKPILHASISCKWTVRSDRVQNSRSEALNLVRNRKGRLPHVAVVTGEPAPSRIGSIALGTGDIDCVYHFALTELLDSVEYYGLLEAKDLLHTMIYGKRLRDIADLPFDLVL